MTLQTIQGLAKINLTLDILGKREDGFHEVAMVMQSIALADTLTLRVAEDSGIHLAIDVPWLAADAFNLAWRAADLMRQTYGIKDGVEIQLTKRIPVAAGLAGGSADAAAVLRGMNQLFALGASDEELCALGAKLGSDIPFTLLGGTMLATGRGEKLERLPDMPTADIVLAKPHVSVSTAWAYKSYDAAPVTSHPQTNQMKRAIIDKDDKRIASLLSNVLESVTMKKYGIISELKEKMLQYGARASLMSGSGPTVFGIAEDGAHAQHIAEALRQLPAVDVFVTKTAKSMRK